MDKNKNNSYFEGLPLHTIRCIFCRHPLRTGHMTTDFDVCDKCKEAKKIIKKQEQTAWIKKRDKILKEKGEC